MFCFKNFSDNVSKFQSFRVSIYPEIQGFQVPRFHISQQVSGFPCSSVSCFLKV